MKKTLKNPNQIKNANLMLLAEENASYAPEHCNGGEAEYKGLRQDYRVAVKTLAQRAARVEKKDPKAIAKRIRRQARTKFFSRNGVAPQASKSN